MPLRRRANRGRRRARKIARSLPLLAVQEAIESLLRRRECAAQGADRRWRRQGHLVSLLARGSARILLGVRVAALLEPDHRRIRVDRGYDGFVRLAHRRPAGEAHVRGRQGRLLRHRRWLAAGRQLLNAQYLRNISRSAFKSFVLVRANAIRIRACCGVSSSALITPYFSSVAKVARYCVPLPVREVRTMNTPALRASAMAGRISSLKFAFPVPALMIALEPAFTKAS